MTLNEALEKNLLPDFLIRWGIRRRAAAKLREESAGGLEAEGARLEKLLAIFRSSPIAVQMDKANEQHYELPAAFFHLVLGKHLKYSSGYWKADAVTLDQSEADMLALTCARAELRDGQDILELGCGWGSLTLWMAARYPSSRLTAVSNSRFQREWIEEQAKQRGLTNLRVITADINQLTLEQTFDRVVSVEMFEHMRGYSRLFEKTAGFLKPGGKLFIHVFSHIRHAYLFEDKSERDWMARYFFTGGTMPSDSLFLYFQEQLKIEKHWRVSGTHYAKTSNAWLAKMDSQREEVMKILREHYGDAAPKWWAYWRIFFMACAELFGYRGGTEWMVSHYLFQRG